MEELLSRQCRCCISSSILEFMGSCIVAAYLDVSVSKFVFCWVGSKCVEIKSKSRVGRASRSTVAETCITLASLPLCGVASSNIRRNIKGRCSECAFVVFLVEVMH